MPRKTTALSRCAAAIAATVLSTASHAVAQTPPPSINLTPSQFPGVLDGPVRIGPMTILNGTQERYRIRPFPVLLGQRRDGGIFVREDGAARAAAGRHMEVQVERFGLVPGEARSVLARIRRVPRSGSFYGGVLFEATPRPQGGRRPQITNILQVTASVLLDPLPNRRRLRFRVGRMRAESVAGRKLRLLVPVTNRGNVYRAATGRVAVRDSSGKLVASAGLRRLRVLPRATVDLRASVAKRLPAGGYRLSAIVRGSRRALRARGTMRLFGVNEVATRTARLVRLSSPTAYRGDEVEVKAAFRNTGNVRHAPGAEVRVRPIVKGRPGRVALTRRMEVEDAEPGEEGEAKAELRLPGSAAAYQLSVRLLAGNRVLDSRDAAVTPRDKPSLPVRAKNYVTDHALVLVGLLLLVIGAGFVLGLGYVRRLKAEAAAKR